MTTVLVVAHADLAQNFSQVIGIILNNPSPPLYYISARWGERREEIANRIKEFFLEHHEDVLILSDLFGSTHSNLCLPYLKRGHVEMITGFNLPILVKAVTSKDVVPLSQLVDKMVDYGKHHVCSAYHMIDDNKDGERNGCS